MRAARIWNDGFLVLFWQCQPGPPDPRSDGILVTVPLSGELRRIDLLLHALLDDLFTLLWGHQAFG